MFIDEPVKTSPPSGADPVSVEERPTPTLTETQWDALGAFARACIEAQARVEEANAAMQLAVRAAGLDGWIVNPLQRTITAPPPAE